MNLGEVSRDLARRLSSLFLPDAQGRRPCHGGDERFASDPRWNDLVLFHEYFHGDTGRGVGASHQTGWTAIVVRCLEDLAAHRRTEKATRESEPAVTSVRRRREKKPPPLPEKEIDRTTPG